MEIETVFGPPGTGKTTELMRRMESEVRSGVDPGRIAFLTFTRKARAVALEEAYAKFGYTKERLPFFSTLHSMCYRHGQFDRNSVIRGPKDLQDFGQRMRIEFSDSLDPWADMDAVVGFAAKLDADHMLHFDHWMRHRMLPFDRALRESGTEFDRFELQRFVGCYAEYKRAERMYDFTDLLAQCRATIDVDVVFVDEAQDLSDLQWHTLFRLTANAKRYHIAGDDDQAIFGWAGASPERMSSMPGRHCVLRQSWRIPSKVHTSCSKLTARISKREPKEFLPRAEEGAVKRWIGYEDLPIKHGESWMVLGRNHVYVRAAATYLKELGLPILVNHIWPVMEGAAECSSYWHRLDLGSSVSPWEAQRLLRMSRSQTSRGCVRKLQQLDQRLQIDRTQLRHLGYDLPRSWEGALERVPQSDLEYLDRVVRTYGLSALLREPTINLGTMHASKGGQADKVALLSGMGARTLQGLDQCPDDELRVWYVGGTRAKSELHLVGDNEILDLM